jgi:hypothetical protein
VTQYQYSSKSVTVYCKPSAAGNDAIAALISDYNAETGKTVVAADGLLSVEVADYHSVMKNGDPLAAASSDSQSLILSISVMEGGDYSRLVLRNITSSADLFAEMTNEGHSGYEQKPCKIAFNEMHENDKTCMRMAADLADESMQMSLLVVCDDTTGDLTYRRVKAGNDANPEFLYKEIHAYGTGKADPAKTYNVNSVGESRALPINSVKEFTLACDSSVTYNSVSHDLSAIFNEDVTVVGCHSSSETVKKL